MELNSEIISLAKEILDDAELSRGSAESLVFKATRLARLVKHQGMLEWLEMERTGYQDKDPDLGYMDYTGRTYDKDTRIGLWGSIAVQEAAIEASMAEMEVVKNFKPSGTYSASQLESQQLKTRALAKNITIYKNIRSKVITAIQDFASNIYYEKMLSQKARDIFAQYSDEIDGLLADHTGTVISMLPSVFERLNAQDEEAINQALLSCRRILDAFIDKLYPPCDTPIMLANENMIIDAEKTKNRYRAYISERTKSKSVKDKLIASILVLYDRTSTAVHKDVLRGEAKALILQLYITLGEILTLGDIPKPIPQKNNQSEEPPANTESSQQEPKI